MRKLITILSSVALLVSLTVSGTMAATKPPAEAKPFSDGLSSPQQDRQAKLKHQAVASVLAGKAKPRGDNKVVKVGNGQYVELAFEGEDQILTLLGEFGTGTDETHGGTRTDADHGGTDGPSHNEIPEPNRAVDNNTIWRMDFNRAYYDDLLYSKTTYPSMANYYREQSSGKYTVDGYVGDWVEVPNNAATYGNNDCGDNVCEDTWFFVDDTADTWWDELVAQEGGVAEANEFLSQFDVWDRYDYDGDADFDEPDGYIDHFQAVHAGMGEEVGGGAQGEDAIWSHRWYAFFSGTGPDGTGPRDEGGVQIGESDYWIGDYTVEPENGGVGVFAHEFAHDLTLPDEYAGAGENSTAWWTLMSQGSYGTQNNIDLGTYPTQMNSYDKFWLGFMENYAVATSDQAGSLKLGPAEFNTKYAQALFVILPDKEVAVNIGDAYEGEFFYYSDSGANLDNTMTRTVTIPEDGDLELNAQVRYGIEDGWDYAYLTVDGVAVNTNLSTNDDPFGQNQGEGITGFENDWTELTADLSAFAGDTVEIGFRYWTDGFVNEVGFQVDALEIPGQALDGAETDPGWTYDGFVVTDGSESAFYENFYIAEFRQYRGYDKSLQLGPYNFGFLNNPDLQEYVEHFPYQEGLLIWYWDFSRFEDNEVTTHPGEGYILPVDSHPQTLHWKDGTLMRPRIQSFDSTFGLSATKKITLHKNSVATTIPSRPGVAVFDDTKDWWFPTDAHGAHNDPYNVGWIGVKVPKTGTTIRAGTNNGSFMNVYLNQ